MSYNFCNSEMPGVACPLMGIYLKIIRYVLIYNALQAREEIARNWASVKKRAGGYKWKVKNEKCLNYDSFDSDDLYDFFINSL